MPTYEFESDKKEGACIKVIGVGGGGGNTIKSMIEDGIEGVEFIAANTDRQALADHPAEIKIQLGPQRTQGLGAGSNPTTGQEAAQETASDIQEQLKGADMVFVTAGMGGGTGTGAAPVIAGIARQLGALTVGVVTKPFKFEGGRRRRYADEGINNLRKAVDTLIAIPNERLLAISGDQMSYRDAFKLADSVLGNAVRSISDLIVIPQIINVDFADVKTVMLNKGFALMGTGIAEGEDRAREAAEKAVCSPLLNDVCIDGATHILINITGPSNMTIQEISSAIEIIEEAASEDALIIWGQAVNDESEAVKVTLIATGFDHSEDDGMDLGTASMGQGNKYASGMMDPVRQSGSYKPPVYRGEPAPAPTPSGTFLPDDVVRKFQEYDAQADNMYSGAVQARQPASYAPSEPAKTPDVFSQVSKNDVQPRSSAAKASAVQKGDNLLDDSDEIDSRPAYLRAGSSVKRPFLDY